MPYTVLLYVLPYSIFNSLKYIKYYYHIHFTNKKTEVTEKLRNLSRVTQLVESRQSDSPVLALNLQLNGSPVWRVCVCLCARTFMLLGKGACETVNTIQPKTLGFFTGL